jgi:sporulation and spore germination protein
VSRTRAALLGAAGVGAAVVVAWLLFAALPRWYGRDRARPAAVAAPAAAAPPGRKIKASLFYVADDGMRLTRVEREVAFAETPVEQARQIIEAQIAPVAEPLVSAVPPETRLRAIFISERGEAFVDVSRELVTGHSGGSNNELLTIYTLVDTLCANLPAIHSVQLLVEGKPVETLAGHVDLRRPLEPNMAWIQ